MKNNKYETPEIKIISMEPDESIMINADAGAGATSGGYYLGTETFGSTP